MDLESFKSAESPVVNNILQFSSNIPLSLYADTTGTKTPESSYRGAFLSRNRLLGEEYLLNFKKGPFCTEMASGISVYHTEAARGAVAGRHFKERQIVAQSEAVVSLDPPVVVESTLHQAVTGRRSVRKWTGKPFGRVQLSTLLFYGQGITGTFPLASEDDPISKTMLFKDSATNKTRTAPSGGGLYPIDIYCIVSDCGQIENGVYRYLPELHVLALGDGPPDPIDTDSAMALFPEFDKEHLRVRMIFVYKMYENSRKYGDGGMAFAFIEAGEIAQNIHLVAAALGCGACDIGGFNKTVLERICKIDGLFNHVIHCMVIGS